jgi:hypothetical protein
MSPEVWAQFGFGALVAGWLLLRTDKRLELVEAALDRLTASQDKLARAQMLVVLSRPDVDEPVKRQARALLHELNGTTGAEA